MIHIHEEEAEAANPRFPPSGQISPPEVADDFIASEKQELCGESVKDDKGEGARKDSPCLVLSLDRYATTHALEQDASITISNSGIQTVDVRFGTLTMRPSKSSLINSTHCLPCP